MLIDWFTVGAQIVNFVILVWLLQHFLYKPILNAIDAREKRIAAELADANAKKAEAEKERADFENKNKAFDEQRSALLSKATDDAKAEGAQLLDKARKDADVCAGTQAAALRNDQKRTGNEITLWPRRRSSQLRERRSRTSQTSALKSAWGGIHASPSRNGAEGKGAAWPLALNGTAPLVRSAFDLPAAERGGESRTR